MSKPDDAKLLLYQFVKDQHDKLFTARQGQKARLNSLLVLFGFFITILCTFGIPTTLASLERAATTAPPTLYFYTIIALVPVVPLAPLLAYLARGLWAILTVLSDVGAAISETDRTTFTEGMHQNDIQGDDVVEDLTATYLDVIERNVDNNFRVGGKFAIALKCARRALAAGAVFLILSVLVRAWFAWQLPLTP